MSGCSPHGAWNWEETVLGGRGQVSKPNSSVLLMLS